MSTSSKTDRGKLTEQGGGVAEVEVQGDAALLRGEGALPLQVRLPRMVARKAQRLGHHVPLAVPAPRNQLRHSSSLRSHISQGQSQVF